MEFKFTAERVFDASHEEEACPHGSRLHGHHWKVSASIQSRFDPIKGRLAVSLLGDDLARLLAELDGRHLNDMLPGTHTMPENIAAWVLERLSLQYRTLYKVKVWQDEREYVSVTREVRI